MIVHFHYSSNSNSGEIRRIRNIDNEICNVSNSKCVEVEFYSMREGIRIKEDNRFKLSSNVFKKYYIPLMPFSGKCWIMQKICDIWTSIVIFCIYIAYKPKFIIGEFSISYSAMLFKHFIKSVFIADMHGALPEEYTYNNSHVNKWKLNYLEDLERATSLKADYIICQSEEMKRHIIKKYSAIESKAFVYKCGVDTDLFRYDVAVRKQIRQQLGIPNDCLVFVYSGGLMKWQKIEESMQIFEKIRKNVTSSKFLILTRDLDLVKEYISKLNLDYICDDIIALSVPFNQVSDYLNCADVAFLLRDDDVMNRVASPTKLAEYLACGLPVISDTVANYWVDNEMIADNSIICYNDNMSIDDLIATINTCNKLSIRKHAEQKFSLDIDSQNIYAMFKFINKNLHI